MSQCKAEVKLHKGVGYMVDDVFRTTFFCLREKGHSGPHHISDPRQCEEDDE